MGAWSPDRVAWSDKWELGNPIINTPGAVQPTLLNTDSAVLTECYKIVNFIHPELAMFRKLD